MTRSQCEIEEGDMILCLNDDGKQSARIAHLTKFEGVSKMNELSVPMNYTSPYLIIEVPIKDIHPSPHQPKSRTEASGPMNQLKRSIMEYGLLIPIAVTRRPDGVGFNLADGHRRLYACKSLAWPSIHVLVCEGKPALLFSTISATTKAMPAKQWLEVYLSDGELPPGPTKNYITKLEEICGRDFLTKLLKFNVSPQVWSLGVRIVKYADIPDDNETRNKLLNWLVDNAITRQVGSWMTMNNPGHLLREAFVQNKFPEL